MDIEQGEMFLQSLFLKNYRAFEELEVNFHKKLTVIVGANGAGKTTILDAAAAALSAYTAGFDGLGLYKITPDDARVKSTKLGDMVDSQPQYPVDIAATANVFYPHSKSGKIDLDTSISDLYSNQLISWKRLRNSGSIHARQNTKEIAPMQEVGSFYQNVIRLGDSADAQLVIAPILAYYSTRRLWENGDAKDMMKTTISRQDAYKGCLDAHLNLSALKTWFERMTYKGLKSGKQSMPFLAVKQAMAGIFGNISGSTEVAVDMNLDTREIEVEFKDINGVWNCLTLNQLSDGYKGTICLVADIAYRMAVLNPQLEDKVLKKTGGIILIDEVDLHLHPTWQQRILDDLEEIFPKVQFIVSTHAPAVINTVKSENVILLDQGQIFEPSGEVHGRDINTIVRNLMQAKERPKVIQDKFELFYKYIDEGDSSNAEKTLNELRGSIGNDDPEIARCNVKLVLLTARRQK